MKAERLKDWKTERDKIISLSVNERSESVCGEAAQPAPKAQSD